MSALSFIAHTKKSWLCAKQITPLTPSNINRVVAITPRKWPCTISSFLSSEAPAIKATFRIACKRRRISSHRFSLVFSYSSVGDTRRPELNTSAFTGYLRRNLGFCNRNPICDHSREIFGFLRRKFLCVTRQCWGTLTIGSDMPITGKKNAVTVTAFSLTIYIAQNTHHSSLSDVKSLHLHWAAIWSD